MADADAGEIELYSGRRKSLSGAPGSGFVQELYLSPIVANLLDSVEFVAKVSADLVSAWGRSYKQEYSIIYSEFIID